MKNITVEVQGSMLSFVAAEELQQEATQNPEVAERIKFHLETAMKFFLTNASMTGMAMFADPRNEDLLAAFVSVLGDFGLAIAPRIIRI